MADVRSGLGVPVAANFASGDGTPIVVNTQAGSEAAYIVNSSGSVVSLSGAAGASAFTQVFVTGQSTVRASVTTSLRVSASSNITLATDATSGTITISAASGAGEAFPVGAIYLSYLTTNPSAQLGYGTWSYLGEGQMLIGMASGIAAFNTVLASGGAFEVVATGTVSQPTFTGDAYTPSGTNAASLTREAVAGTNAVSLTKEAVAGMNAVSLFREAAAGTNAASAVTGSVSGDWPGVPTFAGTTASASASVTWPSGVPAGATATVSVSVTWPTGNPLFTGATGTAHQHELPIIHNSNLVVRFLPTATFGVGASRVPDVRATVTNVLVADVTNSGVVMLSQTAGATVASTGTVSWPASVPNAVSSVGHEHIISWPASVPSALVTGLVPAGVISWPATAPAAVAKTLTAAAQIFTGVTGSVSGQVFTGVTASVSGQIFSGVTASVSAQVFTGVAKAPTGTVSKPTFVGATASVVPAYVAICMWRRTA